jgi:hypothetical protein
MELDNHLRSPSVKTVYKKRQKIIECCGQTTRPFKELCALEKELCIFWMLGSDYLDNCQPFTQLAELLVNPRQLEAGD